MKWLPVWAPLWKLVNWAWVRFLQAVRSASADGRAEWEIRTLPPGTEGLLVSAPATDEAAQRAELERGIATVLPESGSVAPSAAVVNQLLELRRERQACFEGGGWLVELVRAMEPARLDSAGVEERGIQPRLHWYARPSELPGTVIAQAPPSFRDARWPVPPGDATWRWPVNSRSPQTGG